MQHLRRRSSVSFSKPSLTKQSFRQEVDINTILNKYKLNGQLPVMNNNTPRYLDVTNLPDFTTSLNTMISFQQVFDSLPADFRKYLHNDVNNFLDFVQNPANASHLKALGLTTSLSSETGEAVAPTQSKADAPVEPTQSTQS